MTGTVEFQNLCISIAYEVKMVMRDNTLSFYQKLIFCFLKIVCVTGFALGREYPEQRKRAPTLPPPIPNFEKRPDGGEVKAEQSTSEGTENTTDADPKEKTELSDGAPTETTTAAPDETTESSDSTAKEKAESTVVQDPTEFKELTPASADVDLSDFRPTVVIVAPIYVKTLRQRKEVLELIASLDNQTYKAAQVILVDDCSPLAWYKSSVTGQSDDCLVKLPANIRLVRRPKNHGPASARSLGLGLAMAEHQAQIVNFIDSDCEADVHWVEAMVTAHYYELKKKTEGSDGAILSGLTCAYGNTHVDKFHDHFGTLNGRYKTNGDGLLYAPSCNISIRVSEKLISQVGGFDESFPKAAFEDVDYCMRASQCGFTTICVQNAKIWHKYGTSLSELFRMFQRYGASEWAVLERHPHYFDMYGNSYHIPSLTPKVVT